MQRSEVLDKVKAILEEQLGDGANSATEETSFVEDLNADSLDLVELVMELEDKFGIKIPDEDSPNIKTVKDAVDYIMQAKATA